MTAGYIVELRLKETGAMVRQHGPFDKEKAETLAASPPAYITELFTVHVLPVPETMVTEQCPGCGKRQRNIISPDRSTLLYRVCEHCGYDSRTEKVEALPKKDERRNRGFTYGT